MIFLTILFGRGKIHTVPETRKKPGAEVCPWPKMGTDFTGKMKFGLRLAVDFPKTARGLKIY